MMNIKATIKRVISHTSVYFTAITAIYTFLVILTNVSDDRILVSATQILFNFLFSILAAVGGIFLNTERITKGLGVLIHYAVLLFAFYTCYLLPMGMSGVQVFVGIFAFSAVWGIVLGVRALILSRFRANSQKASEYVKQYDRRA